MIPCLNEEATIGKVIDDFRRALPGAEIVVYDNASTDRTFAVAREHGAVVRREKRKGKGFVVGRMVAEEAADYFILVDGDDTYEAAAAPSLLAPLLEGRADVVVGVRKAASGAAFRRFHVFGNWLVNRMVTAVYGYPVADVMSGYRAFTREVARSVPVVSTGFEIETEMMLQLLGRGYIVEEVPVQYRERPRGSFSKLRTVSDGIRVVMAILGIAKSAKPLTFFGSLAAGLALAAAAIAALGLHRWDWRAGEVPTVIWMGVYSLVIVAFVSLGIGAVLHTVNARIMELTDFIRKRLS